VGVPLILVAAFVIEICLERREDARKEQVVLAHLTPDGAQLLSQREQEDACWRHIVRKLRATRPAIEAWAERLGLQCTQPEQTTAIDGQPAHPGPGTLCTQWRGGDPEVTADLSHGFLLIDSAQDYLCSGPFQ
jgi:hypothetical protein